VTIGVQWLKPATKRLLRLLHLDGAASHFHWRLMQAGESIDLFRAYRKNFGAIRGTKLYFQLHLRRYPAGSVVSVQIGRNLPTLALRAQTVDVRVFDQVFVQRQYEFDVSSSPGLIIDGGAHIGCASVFFALKFPQAIIYSIEPEPGNFALLQQNLGSYRNSIPLRAALWSRPAFLSITESSPDSWSFRIAELDQSRSASGVLAVTINEIVSWTGGHAIDILKLDIEGSEKEIFAVRPQQWLPHVRNLVVELHDRLVPGCEEELRKATAPYRFTKSISGECVVLQRNDPLYARYSNYTSGSLI
jgi:FkbM family methyltransferase